jgi:hypothetical protein
MVLIEKKTENPGGKRTLRRFRRRWEVNIK